MKAMKPNLENLANLERRIAKASAKAKALGREALKHPVAGILSLCVLAGVAATTASYSQAGETVVEKPAPLALPAANVTLLNSKLDSRITVTVLAWDGVNATIKMANGTVHKIHHYKLSQESIDLLNGYTLPPTALPLPLDTVIFYKQGRPERVTVLSRNTKGIKFRREKTSMHPLWAESTWENLSQ